MANCNPIRTAKEQIAALTLEAYQTAAADGVLTELDMNLISNPPVEIPKDVTNGDFTTTFALAAAKKLKKSPREIAGILCGYINKINNKNNNNLKWTRVEIAGPGFLNFYAGPDWYADVLKIINQERENYGASDDLKDLKIMVEFVSANPTGPMHMGNARGGVLGDTLAAVLKYSGADVTREFYVNDAGNQIDKFSHSIEARYLQFIALEEKIADWKNKNNNKNLSDEIRQEFEREIELEIPFPEDGYHGDDIKELAALYYQTYGDNLNNLNPEERRAKLARFGLDKNLPKMKYDLERYKIFYDNWFLESSLHNSGYVAETVEILKRDGWTYEKDGALWLKTSEILLKSLENAENLVNTRGLEQDKTRLNILKNMRKLDLKDDVLRRSNGFYTYFAADIAYHRNKFEKRGFDRVINIWGADHHGHVARLKLALDALNLDGSGRLDIVLMQLVKLSRDGEIVRMSKRTGKAISLSDLLDEVPVDAARWFFNSKPDTQMEFDLNLAVREDSENPLYYVEYAHARICSLLKILKSEGVEPVWPENGAELLSHETEKALIKSLAKFPDAVQFAARDYDPSYINRALQDLAACFHRFYTACHIRGEQSDIQAARLYLADAARIVLKNGLNLLGVDAPEKMEPLTPDISNPA